MLWHNTSKFAKIVGPNQIMAFFEKIGKFLPFFIFHQKITLYHDPVVGLVALVYYTPVVYGVGVNVFLSWLYL